VLGHSFLACLTGVNGEGVGRARNWEENGRAGEKGGEKGGLGRRDFPPPSSLLSGLSRSPTPSPLTPPVQAIGH